MTKLSAMVLAAVAFATISVDAASIPGPFASSTPSKRVFSRANDFVYHQASRRFGSDSELSSRETSSRDLLENGIHATVARATTATKSFAGSRRRNEMEDISLSKRDDNNNESERRLVKEVLGAGAVAWGAHELYKDYENHKASSSTSSSATAATQTQATATSTAADDSGLESRLVKEVLGAGAVAWGAHALYEDYENHKASSSSSSAAAATPTPTADNNERRLVKEVLGAGAVAWGAHELYKDYENNKASSSSSVATTTQTQAAPTATPTAEADQS